LGSPAAFDGLASASSIVKEQRYRPRQRPLTTTGANRERYQKESQRQVAEKPFFCGPDFTWRPVTRHDVKVLQTMRLWLAVGPARGS